MASRPDQSLSSQAGNWGDLLGTYRLFNNRSVDPQAIQRPHRQHTLERCRPHRIVLCLQDTSELDYSGHRGKKGLGKISRENGQGLLQHSVLAVLPNGRLLGLLHQRTHVRVPARQGETRRERATRWNEGLFWADGVEATGEAPADTRFITVCDRGGDNFNTFDACDRMNHGFIVRAQHDRCVEHESKHLWAHMEKQPVLKTIWVNVPARGAKRITNKGLNHRGLNGKSQPSRRARVQIRAAQVVLSAPKGDPLHRSPRRVQGMYASEVNPPADVSEPIDWMLLSSETASNAKAALKIIGYYRRRWVIEEYHKVQKSGCGLERTQLRDVEALRRFAALVGVVAVRMLWLRDLAALHLTDHCIADEIASGSTPIKSGPTKSGRTRSTQTIDSAAQTPAALQAMMPPLWIKVVSRLARLDQPDRLTPRQFWRTIAQRGGWLGRKHDGRPGWKTLWRGWHHVALLVEGAGLINSG